MTGTMSSTEIDAIFEEWNRADSPGCAVGVLQGGELVFARGYGMANLDLGVSISPESVFHVASVSKQFTAFAVALLASEGKLGLDDDVRKYVPELPDFGATITLSHLIHHTSGLRDQYGLFRLSGWRDDDVQAFDDVIEFALNHRRLNFPPGSEYSYCNTSYTLLVLVVERVSGMRFRDFIHERFLAPLDMRHSHIHDDVTEIVPQRASAYAPRDGEADGFKVANSTVEAIGAICLYTTVEDLGRWIRNFREREVAAAILDQAMSPSRLNDGSPVRYGFGLQLGEYRGLKTVSHGGVDSGYRAELLWFPEVDFGVVILANLSTIKPGALARQVADQFLADRLGPNELQDAPAVELPQQEQEQLAGLYRDARRSMTRRIERQDDGLIVQGAFGERMPLTPLGDGRFRVGTPPQEVRIVPGEGDVLEYREATVDGKTNVFRRVEPMTPGIETLAEYAGTYSCPDLNVRYTFLVRDGKLTLRLPKRGDEEPTPTVSDAFSLPQADIVFSRDGRGDVSGFDIYTERIRDLHFHRDR